MKMITNASLLRALKTAALSLTLAASGACSNADGPEQQPSDVETVRAKLQGQAIAVVPFDTDDAACRTNPFAMAPAILARCIHLDPSRIPASMEVTSELTRFNPKSRTGSILVLQGPPVDPSRPDASVYAFIGLDGELGLAIAKPVGAVGAGVLDVALLALMPSNMNVTDEQVAMMEGRLLGERVKIVDGLAERPSAGSSSRPPQRDPWCSDNIPTGYTRAADVKAYDVLSREECRALITRIEELGCVPAPITTGAGFVMRPDIRNNTRVVIDDQALAADLFRRVAAHVPAVLASCDVVSANERLRCYRYERGQRFAPHYETRIEPRAPT